MVRKVIGFMAGPERPEYAPLPKREGYGSNVFISMPNKDGIVLLAVMPSAPPLFTAFATSQPFPLYNHRLQLYKRYNNQVS